MVFQRVPQLVSVEIPCHNAAPFLRQCLDSMMAQTCPDKEFILVNDASTDNFHKTLNDWIQDKKNFGLLERDRLTVLDLPFNIGYAGAVTTGMFLARGEFIAMQDADDYSHPERFEKQITYLNHHKNIDLIGTAIVEFYHHSPQKLYKPDWIKYGFQNIKRSYTQGLTCISHGTILFRGTIFDRLGGHVRHPRGVPGVIEDRDFLVRYLEHGIKMDNIPDVLYYYRLHSGQRSGRGK